MMLNTIVKKKISKKKLVQVLYEKNLNLKKKNSDKFEFISLKKKALSNSYA